MTRSSPTTPVAKTSGAHFGRYIVIGFFTIAPLWVTWLVVDFVFSLLARTGAPILRGIALGLRPMSEGLAEWLQNPIAQYVVAVLLTLGLLYWVGLLTALVLGQRLIGFMERQLERLPLVQSIYGATKRFLRSLQSPVSTQRVVLIAFPSPEMKAVGLVTRVLSDPKTGRKLAAVYVPTSPNPTSGYIEIVPLEDVVQTDWSVEEAMAFVMTGGTNGPDTLPFSNLPGREKPEL